MRERGLKQKQLENKDAQIVAPHAGAWVETCFTIALNVPPLSLPMRERGLKQWYEVFLCTQKGSLPMRERGLKREQKNV